MARACVMGRSVALPSSAAAMAVVLLCITLLMFVVQKYVLEAKSTATLSGKASRQRMLITDRSVRLPLAVACSLLAVFVIVMYLCVPFGALFKTWGYDFSLTTKWFQQVFASRRFATRSCSRSWPRP